MKVLHFRNILTTLVVNHGLDKLKIEISNNFYLALPSPDLWQSTAPEVEHIFAPVGDLCDYEITN